MRFFTTFLIIILSAVCSYAQPSAIVDEIDSKYSILAATGRFNGTVLYAENGKVVYKKAFGVSDARTGEPLTTSSAFEHAATLVHPFLAPVDVHRQFPGMDANPTAAFERLWEERHAVPIAGLDCPVPSLTAQRLVLVLHATRAGQLQHSDIQRSWTFATDDERAAVRRLADELGAEVALAAGTGRLADYDGTRGYELWRGHDFHRAPVLLEVYGSGCESGGWYQRRLPAPWHWGRIDAPHAGRRPPGP